MKKFKTICLLLAVMAGTLATAQNTITIHGKVSGDTKGYNSVYYYFPGSSKDSAVIKNGEFKIEMPFTGTFTPAFYTQYEISGKRAYRPFPMLIDQPGTIEIEMDIEKGFRAAKITGIKTTELYNSFLTQQDAAYKQIGEEVIKLYGKPYLPNNDPLAPKLMASRDSLSKVIMGKLVRDFVLSNKDSKIGIFILNGSGKSVFSVEELEKTFNQLPENMRKTEDGLQLAAYLRGIKGTKVGSIPKNFVLNDEKGQPFSLDQYKGKYIWIDFWASWCGPCKMAFPLMREIYAAYKDKNLEIIGISTDTKIEPWLKSLETIKNPWKQVWDNKNVMSEFAVTAFPTSFLIGPDGKILVKEIGYNPDEKGEIFKKLEELLGPSNITFPKPKEAVKETKPQGEVKPGTMTNTVPGMQMK